MRQEQGNAGAAEWGWRIRLAMLGSAALGMAVLPGLVAPAPAFASKSPPHRAPDVTIADTQSFRPEPGMAALGTENLDKLLDGAEVEIADSEGTVPLNGVVGRTLSRVAAALPKANLEQRTHARELAAVLFNRAQVALRAGNIDEEQHWLALGALLAPPPVLHPSPTERLDHPPVPVATPKLPENQTTATAVASAGAAPIAANPAPADSASAAAASGAPENFANAAAAATPDSAGISYSVHYASGSPGAAQAAQDLATRFGATLEGGSPHDIASHVAIIRYAGQGGHEAAMEAGRALSKLRYPWRLQRLSADGAAGATVQVWLPPDRTLARRERRGAEPRASVAEPAYEPQRTAAAPASDWRSRPSASTSSPSWRSTEAGGYPWVSPPQARWYPPPYYWRSPPYWR